MLSASATSGPSGFSASNRGLTPSAQMAVEEGADGLIHLVGLDGVGGMGEEDEFGFDAVVEEALVEIGGVVGRDDGVVRAVKDEVWGGGGRDVGKGAGGGSTVEVFVEGAAEEGGGHFDHVFSGNGIGSDSGEMGGTAGIADSEDGAVLIIPTAATLEIGQMLGGCHEGGKVTAGGDSPQGEAIGIKVEIRGMGAEPASHQLAIMEAGGKGGFMGKAVGDGGHGDALVEKAGLERWPVLDSLFPAAAVNIDQQGEGASCILRQIEIEEERAGASADGNIGNGEVEEGSDFDGHVGVGMNGVSTEGLNGPVNSFMALGL